MAELFPDEGIDIVLSVAPKGGAMPDPLYLGLFASQTPTTVPARGAVLATETGVTEVTGQGYARIAVDAGDWGAPGTNGSGRKITAGTYSFIATAGAGLPWDAANGFFLADAAVNGHALYYANFNSGVARQLQVAGDQLDVTPSWQDDG